MNTGTKFKRLGFLIMIAILAACSDSGGDAALRNNCAFGSGVIDSCVLN